MSVAHILWEAYKMCTAILRGLNIERSGQLLNDADKDAIKFVDSVMAEL